MIALAIATALIIQTYDGQTRVVENLSPEGCKAARCLAQFGHSCAAQETEDWQSMKDKIARQTYEATHPFICEQFEGISGRLRACHRQGEPLFSTGAMDAIGRPSASTKTAMCVK